MHILYGVLDFATQQQQGRCVYVENGVMGGRKMAENQLKQKQYFMFQITAPIPNAFAHEIRCQTHNKKKQKLKW